MKKLVYAMLVALVGSPPAIAQSDGAVEETELTAEEQAVLDAEKSEAAGAEPEILTEEEAAANDAAKASLEAADEDAKPAEESE